MDIHAATRQRFPDVLPSLSSRRLVDRADVRDPGSRRPTWIYRINAAGARYLSLWPMYESHVPAPLTSEEEASASRFLIPHRSLAVLQALRTEYRDPDARPRFKAERGWMMAAEIREVAEDYFFSEDVAWLVARGLIARRDEYSRTRTVRPAVYYRVTRYGLAVEPLEFRYADDG